MTRYHYIKKMTYFRYRLHMLSYNKSTKMADCYLSDFKKNVPFPPFKYPDGRIMAYTYAEAWENICKAMRTIEGLEDLK